jgi:hypothetical protein
MCSASVQVLLNILRAHTAAYTAMKSVPGAEDIQIGMVHHHIEFMPVNPKHWWIKPLAWWGTYWWGRDTVLHFMQTGEFDWFVPLWGRSACPALACFAVVDALASFVVNLHGCDAPSTACLLLEDAVRPQAIVSRSCPADGACVCWMMSPCAGRLYS